MAVVVTSSVGFELTLDVSAIDIVDDERKTSLEDIGEISVDPPRLVSDLCVEVPPIAVADDIDDSDTALSVDMIADVAPAAEVVAPID